MATAKGGTDTGEAPFTEAQESRLAEIVAAAIKGAGPGDPPKSSGAGDKPPPTDDEWASMGPRARESYMEGAVGRILAQMRRDEKVEALEAEIASLKAGKVGDGEGGKPETAPAVWSKLTRFLWGDPTEADA